jgi:5,10-methylenetetrahydromethanopterin reductase
LKLAEKLGFDYAWIADVGLNRDVYVTMAACAMRTRSIFLGTSVTNPYTRHPAVTATAFATLDEISGGRMVIGLGIGSKRNLLEPLGISRGNIGETCREAIKVMRHVLSGKKSSFDGQLFKLKDVELGFRSKRMIPIYLAGRGEGTLTVAGEIADGAIFSSLTTPRAISYAMNAIIRGENRAGRDLWSVERVLFTRVLMSRDGDQAREAIRPHVPYRIWDDTYDTLRQLGYDEKRVTNIKKAYTGGKLTEACQFVTDQMIEDFAIAGTPQQCIEKVEKIRSCGVTHLIASPVQTEYPARRRLLKQLSDKVISRFR